MLTGKAYPHNTVYPRSAGGPTDLFPSLPPKGKTEGQTVTSILCFPTITQAWARESLQGGSVWPEITGPRARVRHRTQGGAVMSKLWAWVLLPSKHCGVCCSVRSRGSSCSRGSSGSRGSPRGRGSSGSRGSPESRGSSRSRGASGAGGAPEAVGTELHG